MSAELEHIGHEYAEKIERQRQRVMQNGAADEVLENLETLGETLYSADSYVDRVETSVFINHQEFQGLNSSMADALSEGGEALSALYAEDKDVYEEVRETFSAAAVAASYASQKQFSTADTPVQEAFGLDERLPDSYTEIMDELGISGDGELPI
ncbi:MAG: hypothetical protein ABEJ75_01145 [Candidatus Nanohaloarchaea archaeon]